MLTTDKKNCKAFKIFVLFFLSIAYLTFFCPFTTKEVKAQATLSINSITDNRNSYSNQIVPKYSKFEITFQISGSVAKNFNFSYTPPNSNLYPGYENFTYDQGISVDAQFLPPGESNWGNSITQPAFYYQEFLDETHLTQWGADWYYPTGNFYWKVRFAPNQEGIWQYRILVSDASGSVISSPRSFSVGPSSSHGFIKVAEGDNRYFEFEDGTLFPALGYNMNYDHIGWINPEYDSPTNFGDNIDHFKAMSQNGINLIRIWLSQWSIFGSHWNPWREAASNGYDPPWTWLIYDPAKDPDTEFAFQISSNPNRCFLYGLNTPHPAVKPNTRYRIRVSYKTSGLSGVPTSGFVVKFVNSTENCSSPSVGNKITPVVSTNTDSFSILEGSFVTGANQYFLDFLAFALENVSSGMAEVRYVWIEEDLGGGRFGPNILAKPYMDHHRYFDQRNSFAFDKVVEMAQQNGVYLRVVVHDWREEILSSFTWNGFYTSSPSSANFYGPTDGSLTRSRWLEMQWWRYLQARWGYSSAIHSWEFVNEGTPGIEHAVAANLMGNYFHQFVPKHLSSTSVWSGTTSSWNLDNYQGIDFGDVHCYIRQSGTPCVPLADFYDEAQASIDASNQWGSSNPNRWPVIRGETGFVNSDNLDPNLTIRSDSKGVWLHNFLWAQLNVNSLIESYWFENWHIYDCPGGSSCGSSLRFDHRSKFKPIFDFLKDIPLNKGGYSDISANISNNDLRLVGQKNTSQNRAHLWVQNKKHSWCAVIGGVSGCPNPTWSTLASQSKRLTGNVSIPGFSPNITLPVEWWLFDENSDLVEIETSVQTTDSQGVLSLNLDNLPTWAVDTGVKVGNYDLGITPTSVPTQTFPRGDANEDGVVDGIDYVIWLNHYEQETTRGNLDGDFNNDGRVDGIDYVIWLNNYSF